MKRSVYALVLLLALLVGTVSGCGRTAEPEPPAPAEPEVELRFFHYNDEAEEAYQRVFDAYEALHPNVRIESEFLNSEKYDETLAARIAVQSCPDILGAHPGLAQAIPLAESGYLADLTDQSCLNGVDESLLETATVDGRVYAVPLGMTLIATFYNRDIFRTYGLTPPETWTEFLEVCQTLQDQGITPISLGGGDLWVQSLIPYALAVTTIYRDQPDFDQRLQDGRASFSGPEWQRTMEMVQTLIQRGYVSEDYRQRTYEQQLTAFATGEAAMMVMGTWSLSLVRDINPDCDVGLFLTPGSDDGVNWAASSIGSMVAVSQQSANRETAMDVLNFLLGDDQVYRQFLADTGNLSVRADLRYDCDEELQPVLEDMAGSHPYLDVRWSSEFQTAFMRAVGEISAGADIATVLEELDQRWNEFLEEDP